MQLDTEKFKAVKELAEIQVAVSEGRAALLKLKESTDEYLHLREVETHDRIEKVLRESGALLENIEQNFNELVSFGKELRAFAQTVGNFSKEVVALSQDLREKMVLADKQMTEKYAAVEEILKRIKIERIQIREDRKQSAREQAEAVEQMRLMHSERGALDRAWKELEIKKQ